MAYKNPLDLAESISIKPTDRGNYRYFATPSRMDKNNKWIGDYYDLHTAYGYPKDEGATHRTYKFVGKTKDGADIIELPDGYYSTNPRITGLAAKSIDDLQKYQDWENSQRKQGKGIFLEDFFNSLENK